MGKKKDRKVKAEAAVDADATAKLSRKDFEEELYELQVDLVRLQSWVKATGARIIVVFEAAIPPARAA